MLSCKEVTQLISESLDRRLPLGRRIALRMHLLMCKLCSRYNRQVRFITYAIRHSLEKLGDQHLSVGGSLSPEARERIERSLEENEQ